MENNGINHCVKNLHSHCFACGKENPKSLQLEFVETDDGGVLGKCVLDRHYQGYPGYVQGGITATILDSAMTNCLFQHNIEALTARLNISYREPVTIDDEIIVKAAIINKRNRVYDMEAILIQHNITKASASARFMVKKHAI